jgi:hypothetical protein
MIIRGIPIRRKDGIESIDLNGNRAIYRYKIPANVLPPGTEWIKINLTNHPSNFSDGSYYSGMNPILTDAAMQMVRSYLPNTPIKYLSKLLPPDVVEVEPVPGTHIDFSIDASRTRLLTEIQPTMRDYFSKLFILDVKIALYEDLLRSARENGMYSGIEVTSYISDWSNAASERDALIEIFDGDWWKSSDLFREEMLFGY